ncbi:MAG: 4Fe-4S dicluster domain-containing protein [Verrucomicrobiae bacterium]|nr:4Fe-4S dicluster domain-containing protein [Verrucomicrobiae bacterium]
MNQENQLYRRLQQHLDRQPVGFASTLFGSEIRLLKQLFTTDEAKIALLLSYRPAPLAEIAGKAAPSFSEEQIAESLNRLLMKGAIGWKKKNGLDLWFIMPMIVGMYEAQDGRLTPELAAETGDYLKTPSFGKSFLSVSPPQLRTIPINKSLPVDHPTASYDQIRELVRSTRGPLVALKCLCREERARQKEPCSTTTRSETCLALGDMAARILLRQHGREVTREEALAILEQNEKDGLVLQPANTQQVEFVCSCCGCCCGMLRLHQRLPHPQDFWISNFFAEISTSACTGCGRCVSRCQVKAVSLSKPTGKAILQSERCIGCGLCVPGCPVHAIQLKPKPSLSVPPQDEEELLEQINANKKSNWRQWIIFLRAMLGLRR